MADIDVLFLPEARFFYEEEATAEERLRFNRIIEQLREAPEADDKTRFTLYSGTPERILYHDGSLWVIYEMLNAWTLRVIGLGTVA
jgi:hypothetical protein